MIREIEFSNYLDELPKLIENKNETVFVTADKTYVLIGQDPINEDYCKENALPILKTHKFGGTIVDFKDDLCIGNYTSNKEATFGNDCMIILRDYLLSKGLNANIIKNDCVIDNEFKVGSWGSFIINNCLYTYVHITINMDIELLKNICLKEMIKVPKALNDYGISFNDIKDLYNSKLK